MGLWAPMADCTTASRGPQRSFDSRERAVRGAPPCWWVAQGLAAGFGGGFWDVAMRCRNMANVGYSLFVDVGIWWGKAIDLCGL